MLGTTSRSVQACKEGIHFPQDVRLVRSEDIVIGIRQANDVCRWDACCECMRLAGCDEGVVGNDFSFEGGVISQRRIEVEIVRTREDGKHRNRNPGVFVSAKIDGQSNGWNG